jgi:transposase
MAPVVRRTWAPRGQTPLLPQRGRSWRKVSAIVALIIPPARDRVRCYFRLYPDANADGPRVRGFLRQLLRTLRCPLTLLWDRSTTHRGEPVKGWLAATRGVRVTLLPPYAPELNPVEAVWGYANHHPLANFAPLDRAALTRHTHATARSVARRQRLLRALLRHSRLFLRLR